MTVPSRPRRVASVEVVSEAQTPRGWSYRIAVEDADGERREHEVTLSWVDHDHLCGGRFAPSRVVEVLVRYAYEHPDAPALPPRFDASTVRRWLPRLDEDLLPML